MYIFWFERVVRRVVLEQGGPRDWALPYWNYSRGFPTNTLPPPFREPRMPDGRPNPPFLPEPGRSPAGINRGAQMPQRSLETDTALALDRFTPPPPPGFGGSPSAPVIFPSSGRQFPGALEVFPHNAVHGFVGGSSRTGVMSEPSRAAHDPIFWLHHSNIDRVWARWRAAGGADPTDRRFLDQRFDFVDENGVPVRTRVGDVIDPARTPNLDYRYDDEPPLVARRPTRLQAAMTAPTGGGGRSASSRPQALSNSAPSRPRRSSRCLTRAVMRFVRCSRLGRLRARLRAASSSWWRTSPPLMIRGSSTRSTSAFPARRRTRARSSATSPSSG